MTDREYLTDRTRDQITDALGGGALADIFTHLWDSITQDENAQLQAIGYTVGKLRDLKEPGAPITPYSAASITANLQTLPTFNHEFPLMEQAQAIYCLLAIAARLHYCRGRRASLTLTRCLIDWSQALTS